jgi:hypothetical protein
MTTAFEMYEAVMNRTATVEGPVWWTRHEPIEPDRREDSLSLHLLNDACDQLPWKDIEFVLRNGCDEFCVTKMKVDVQNPQMLLDRRFLDLIRSGLRLLTIRLRSYDYRAINFTARMTHTLTTVANSVERLGTYSNYSEICINGFSISPDSAYLEQIADPFLRAVADHRGLHRSTVLYTDLRDDSRLYPIEQMSARLHPLTRATYATSRVIDIHDVLRLKRVANSRACVIYSQSPPLPMWQTSSCGDFDALPSEMIHEIAARLPSTLLLFEFAWTCSWIRANALSSYAARLRDVERRVNLYIDAGIEALIERYGK